MTAAAHKLVVASRGVGRLPSEQEIRMLVKPLAVDAAGQDADRIGVVEEFCLPSLNVRADIAVVGSELAGYEIKSPADSLRRLPGQIAAFNRVFDRCFLVAATRHLDQAAQLLPDWWGIIAVNCEHGLPRLESLRDAAKSPEVDVELVVRLLWRNEVAEAIREHGLEPQLHRGRGGMWAQLLACAPEHSIRASVRNALRARDAWATTSGQSRIKLAPAPAR